MKKKKIILFIIMIVVVLLILWILNRPESLGNIAKKYNEPTTSASSITFVGETREKIEFSFKSTIKSGAVNVTLYDSNGNLVYELDKEKSAEPYFVLDKTDTYTLEVKYVDFVGSFKVKVYSSNS